MAHDPLFFPPKRGTVVIPDDDKPTWKAMTEMVDKPNKCRGHLCQIRWRANDKTDEHECPFQTGVNNNSDYRCTCCETCQQNCQDDV